MTNQEKIKQADKLIREVLISEIEIINGNETSLKYMSNDVIDNIVEHWYCYRESEIFINENGVEIDEFLNIV